MKKTIVSLVFGMLATVAQAQGITTVEDIMNEQQKVTNLNAKEEHFRQVWARKHYFNLGYVTGEMMSPKENILTGVDNPKYVSNKSSNWGLSLMMGNNIGLHKKPIANTVKINLDIAFDLTLCHYAAQDNGTYDSSKKTSSDSLFLMPWNPENYKLQVGLGLGPSVTVAPFTALNNQELHFIKLNIYYHIGYQLSGLLQCIEDNADMGKDTDAHNKFYEKQNNLAYGHGLTSVFGFNLSWKAIGIGYEYCSSTARFKPVDSKFDNTTSKFDIGTNRLYIQIRY